MNETARIRLRDAMDAAEGWGRDQGREVYRKLLSAVESSPGATVFQVSLEGVKRVDISFASETVVELARRYRKIKGFCLADLSDPDMLENWAAAAERKQQPLMVWSDGRHQLIGASPSKGVAAALAFALDRGSARAADFAASVPGMSIANASMKFKQLWEQGFLLRRESSGESGGIEYRYYRIG